MSRSRTPNVEEKLNKSFNEVLQQVRQANDYDYNSMIKSFQSEERREKLKKDKSTLIKKMNNQWKENLDKYNDIREKRHLEYQVKLEKDLKEKAHRVNQLSMKKKVEREIALSQMKIEAGDSKRRANEKVEEHYKKIEQERRSLARSLTSKSNIVNFSGSAE